MAQVLRTAVAEYNIRSKISMETHKSRYVGVVEGRDDGEIGVAKSLKKTCHYFIFTQFSVTAAYRSWNLKQ